MCSRPCFSSLPLFHPRGVSGVRRPRSAAVNVDTYQKLPALYKCNLNFPLEFSRNSSQLFFQNYSRVCGQCLSPGRICVCGRDLGMIAQFSKKFRRRTKIKMLLAMHH